MKFYGREDEIAELAKIHNISAPFGNLQDVLTQPGPVTKFNFLRVIFV